MCNKKRQTSIDAVAGLLMLYVMALHMSPSVGGGVFMQGLHCLFFYFMAWFFFKAGLFFKSDTPLRKEWNAVFKRLVLPLLMFTLWGLLVGGIWRFISGDMNWMHYIISPIKEFVLSGYTNDNSALWFLPVLISVRLLYLSCCKMFGKRHDRAVDIVLFLLSCFLLIFFNYLRQKQRIAFPNYFYSIPLAMSFFIAARFFKNIHYNGLVLVLSVFTFLFIRHTCFSYVVFMSGTLSEGNSEIVFILASLSCIIIIDNIFRFFSRYYSFPLLRFIGRNSLYFFGFHLPIIISLNRMGLYADTWLSFILILLGLILGIMLMFQFIRIIGISYLFGEK